MLIIVWILLAGNLCQLFMYMRSYYQVLRLDKLKHHLTEQLGEVSIRLLRAEKFANDAGQREIRKDKRIFELQKDNNELTELIKRNGWEPGIST